MIYLITHVKAGNVIKYCVRSDSLEEIQSITQQCKIGYASDYRSMNAWRLLHALGLFPMDDSGWATRTTGPFTEEFLKNVPEAKRWRKLDKQEVENLG